LCGVLPGELFAETTRRARDEHPRLIVQCHDVQLLFHLSAVLIGALFSVLATYRRALTKSLPALRHPIRRPSPGRTQWRARGFVCACALRIAHLQQVPVGIENLDQADTPPW
jgi:hypothetical protein